MPLKFLAGIVDIDEQLHRWDSSNSFTRFIVFAKD